KRKSQKSFVEKYELKAGAIIVALSALLSLGWWQLLAADALFNYPWVQKAIPWIILAFAVYVLQFSKFPRKTQSNILRALTHTTALTVAFLLFWDWFNWLHLDISWYQKRTFFTGQAGIVFLILTLACSPLITLFGWSALNALKKPLGNYSFFFIVIHLFLFTIDYSDFGQNILAAFQEAILKKYALVGLSAFLLLIPLAATSNKWSQKKLGKKWKKLHRLVYLIAVLASVHYIWVHFSKLALAKPITFAIIIAFLLFLRVNTIKTAIRNFKRKRRSTQRAAA
ncbi:MAG TPA: hypothetical protein ENJ56_07460, partial [Anaerolineae bacterium]|nr:hypothetical protein [Anaerolineae bacterium]